MRMLQEHIRQRLELVVAVGRAGRVGRRVEQEPLRLRRDGSFQIGGRQLEVVLLRRLHEHGRAAAKRHHFRVGHPVGCGNDDFIPCVHRRHESIEKNLLSTGADDRLLRLVVKTVLALELFRDRLAQLGNAGHRRILCLAAIDGIDRRLLHVVRRVEIRLAGPQTDHVATLRFEFAGFL